MQLTSFTDYALRTLIYVASLNDERLTNISEITELLGVQRSHMMKIVNKLAQLDYLETIRGRHGGIRLKMPAEQIYVGKLMRDIEPLNLINCSPEFCSITSACRLKNKIEQAKVAFLSELDECSILSLVENNEELMILLAPAKP
ncbi:nitric oxide-sensing transcriptional repressor NsrR [Vibrio sp. AK197]|uniref:Nitric oxide-sensing transcriptional repressor NsrR n=1 Tax=Vibrio olivae TaxID=1243002 RepID=A0ABV5HKD7_9VIBR